MEFREFSNPESKDYDITSSFKEESLNGYSNEENTYAMSLMNLIGILEDEEFDNIYENYGITEYEYLHPNAEVIAKVESKLDEKSSVNHR
ncbi:MAG: hypothetical protein IKX00_00195 [Bacilli bacterium]|nr:hypothetical protein [Bacilli bacterium]